jgi:hypothetical protein
MSIYSPILKKIFVFGGYDGWDCLNSVEVINFDESEKN